MMMTIPTTESDRRESQVEVRILVLDETGPGGIIYKVDQKFAKAGCPHPCKERGEGIVWITGIFPAKEAREVIALFFNPNGTVKEEYSGKILARE